MIEYYPNDLALKLYHELDHEQIDNLLTRSYELRRDPEERRREKVEKASEELMNNISEVIEIDGRMFNTKHGLFEDEMEEEMKYGAQ